MKLENKDKDTEEVEELEIVDDKEAHKSDFKKIFKKPMKILKADLY